MVMLTQLVGTLFVPLLWILEIFQVFRAQSLATTSRWGQPWKGLLGRAKS